MGCMQFFLSQSPSTELLGRLAWYFCLVTGTLLLALSDWLMSLLDAVLFTSLSGFSVLSPHPNMKDSKLSGLVVRETCGFETRSNLGASLSEGCISMLLRQFRYSWLDTKAALYGSAAVHVSNEAGQSKSMLCSSAVSAPFHSSCLIMDALLPARVFKNSDSVWLSDVNVIEPSYKHPPWLYSLCD